MKSGNIWQTIDAPLLLAFLLLACSRNVTTQAARWGFALHDYSVSLPVPAEGLSGFSYRVETNAVTLTCSFPNYGLVQCKKQAEGWWLVAAADINHIAEGAGLQRLFRL